MRILPAVNCPSFHCVEERVALAASFPAPAVHIDVADGRFSLVPTWRDVGEFGSLRARYPSLSFQIHLMLEDPEVELAQWIEAGANEVIVHVEALESRNVAARYPETTIWIGVKSETAMEDVLPFLTATTSVLLLAVPPGLSGKHLDLSVVEKARSLRERFPNAPILVDGGVSRATLSLIREFATVAVAASAIFGATDPARAYRELCAA